MPFLRNLLVLSCMSAAALVAHATSTQGTYSFSNTILQDKAGNQATITGTLEFTFNTTNPSLDTVDAANFTINASGNTYIFGPSIVNDGAFLIGPGANSRIFELSDKPPGSFTYALFLELPIYSSNPMPFALNGGTLCPVGAGCYAPFFSSTTYFDITATGDTYNDISGTLQLVSATPEPSTLVLLGTGIVSVLGLARRRLRSA